MWFGQQRSRRPPALPWLPMIRGDTHRAKDGNDRVQSTFRPSTSLSRYYWLSLNSTMQLPANFTQLLTEWHSGHPQALDRLTPLVYDELRRLARNYMRGERSSHTLQATALVHEAFLQLIQADVEIHNRTHFFVLTSRLMRRVLVDHAKSRSRLKRNAGIREFDSQETDVPAVADFDVIALDEALEGLLQIEPHLAQLIELHYFGGLTYDQMAAATESSAATVHRNLRLARAWLLNEIGRQPSA
jgi:RNA polymerase sigma factor (TIGR02999 family)